MDTTTGSGPAAAPVAALTRLLRTETTLLHRAAERAGIMPSLLRGDCERHTYCVLLRNLHAIYSTLEAQLARRAAEAVFADLPLAALARAGALDEDLTVLSGEAWERDLPLCTATRRYRARLEQIAAQAPFLLLAHAYVRYLGDVSGGQLLAPRVGRALGLGPGSRGLAFYRFDADPKVLGARIRAAIDRAPLGEGPRRALVAEACSAFRTHVELFEELASPARP